MTWCRSRPAWSASEHRPANGTAWKASYPLGSVERVHARQLLGRGGEDAAAGMYEKLGFRVVDRNYRDRTAEIDLVLRRGRTLVFCEVRSRRSARWGEPAETVDRRKQARLRALAGKWLREHGPGRVEVRFDVVSVIVTSGRILIRHVPEAF